MRTYNRNNTSNVKQAKKASKALRMLRKHGGNVSLFKATGEPKPTYSKDPLEQEGYGLGNEGWDG